MAKIAVANAVLTVELGFWETLGSLSRGLEIKLSEITHVEAVEKVRLEIFGYRLAGTGLPGVALLGHFRRSKKKLMVYWVRGQQAVIVDVKSGPYQRIILGCKDAKALAKQLQN